MSQVATQQGGLRGRYIILRTMRVCCTAVCAIICEVAQAVHDRKLNRACSCRSVRQHQAYSLNKLNEHAAHLSYQRHLGGELGHKLCLVCGKLFLGSSCNHSFVSLITSLGRMQACGKFSRRHSISQHGTQKTEA